MTRGRDENTALVVTADRNIETAADILRQVVASDRADIPAITQRRELANRIPPIVRVPQPEPRCHIPDWWHTLRADVVDEIHSVERALGTMRTEAAQRSARLKDAATDAQHSVIALSPYRHEHAAAVKQLVVAETAHAAAEKDLADSGVLGRRGARSRLAEAAVDLAEARAVVSEIDARWKPQRDAAFWANSRHEEMADTNRMLDRVDGSRRLPEQLAEIRDQLDALDTWRRWAEGGEMTVDGATVLVETLDATEHPNYRALADAVCRITPELIDEPEPPAVEYGHEYSYPEVDLGIDL